MRTSAELDITGYLGRDAEVRTTQGGTTIVHLSVGVNADWNKDTRRYEKRNWWRVVVIGDKACEFARGLRKGEPVRARGELKLNNYEKDGVQREVVECVVFDARGIDVLLGAKDRNGGRATPAADEMPF